MIAYDYEVLQSKDLFTLEIKEAVEKLPSALSFTSELNDFIMLFLILNPKDRLKTRTLCTHPWLCGAFDSILNRPPLNPINLLSESSFANLSNGTWNSGPKSDVTTNSYIRINTISNDNSNNSVITRPEHFSPASFPSPVPSSLSSSCPFIDLSINHQFKSIVISKCNQLYNEIPNNQGQYNTVIIDKINNHHCGIGSDINLHPEIREKTTDIMNHNDNDDSEIVNI